MYGKMHEFGLIEIIPLTCTLTILFFSLLNPIRVHRWGGCSGGWLVGCNIVCLLTRQVTFFVVVLL